MRNTDGYNKFISITLIQTSKYLEIIGFTYQSNEFYNDSLNLEHVKINFLNSLIDRSIELNYSKNNYDGVVRDHVSVFIANAQKSYILEDVLEYEKIYYIASQFSISKYEGSFEQQVEGFCKYLINLFENPKLKQWLIGEKWADIPFDWGRYK